ncbi:MAG: FkbM family methyltransferase [Bacteroidales bacterium]|jgi:hypothetical protein|nr:FkbM family methyltransferase [Bacteroidales bacterium]
MIQCNNIILHKAGLYSANKDMYFERSGASSRLAKTHNKELVKLVSLDEYLSEQERSEITYIKLDIEGAELTALKGMKETIADFKPKLAICIYHKAEDLWELPLFIHELNPDYKLYIRHHWKNFTETVLYAIP